jgi:hypothetical protein
MIEDDTTVYQGLELLHRHVSRIFNPLLWVTGDVGSVDVSFLSFSILI